jgi:hypothetical protein
MGAAICRPLLSASMMSSDHLGIAVGLVQLDSRALWRTDGTFDPAMFVYAQVPEAEPFRPKDAGT